MRYRRKPTYVDAVQWRGNNQAEIVELCTGIPVMFDREGMDVDIPTLDIGRTVGPGDVVVKDERGCVYPCKVGTFLNTYEECEVQV